MRSITRRLAAPALLLACSACYVWRPVPWSPGGAPTPASAPTPATTRDSVNAAAYLPLIYEGNVVRINRADRGPLTLSVRRVTLDSVTGVVMSGGGPSWGGSAPLDSLVTLHRRELVPVERRGTSHAGVAAVVAVLVIVGAISAAAASLGDSLRW